MGIFNLLDSLSKSFEKRATLGYIANPYQCHTVQLPL